MALIVLIPELLEKISNPRVGVTLIETRREEVIPTRD